MRAERQDPSDILGRKLERRGVYDDGGKLAHLMVESLCATTMVVRPVLALSRAACTTFSLPVSRADVASSSSRIFGFLTTEHHVS